jgi:hypothetical protein
MEKHFVKEPLNHENPFLKKILSFRRLPNGTDMVEIVNDLNF